jgi:hypothetical protein
MDESEYELVFLKEGIVVRKKVDLPLSGQTWVDEKISYDNASKFNKIEITVTHIEPKLENGILKEIKLKANCFNIINDQPLDQVKTKVNEEVNIIKLQSIKSITNRSYIGKLKDGVKVRFEWLGISYETSIDSNNGIEPSLNSLIQSRLKTPNGSIPSVNIYRDINARYFDGSNWHRLEELRK